MKKNVIFSNLNVDYDKWKDDYEDYLDSNGYTEDDMSLYEFVDEDICIWAQDEQANLNKELPDSCVIVCFADLGLWDGHKQGAKVMGSKLNSIINANGCDEFEVYCDQYNVRGTGSHHDGTNTYLYRVCKDRDEADKMINKWVYDEVDEEYIRKRTKSLRSYVAKVYGF